jgi:predicted nuclease with TOPRIM domain
MADATATFQQLAQKLNQLLKLQENTLRENEKLTREKQELQQQLSQLLEEKAQLQERLTIAETAAGNIDGKARKSFEKQINQYLADIDKVIAHLNA